ncbi:MAG: hypothetical protein IKM82_00405, partial [Oscillospiraceae bacterium]|nr:hypothetical protein [Oscillospiraceae bacterium]
ITDTTFRDGQQARPLYTVRQIARIFDLLHKLGGKSGLIQASEFFMYSQKDRKAIETSGGKKIRIIFDGMQSNEPVISNMTLDCQAPVNILFADTKDFDGIVYGHMIIELPTDPHQAEKVITWLKNSPVKWKEER